MKKALVLSLLVGVASLKAMEEGAGTFKGDAPSKTFRNLNEQEQASYNLLLQAVEKNNEKKAKTVIPGVPKDVINILYPNTSEEDLTLLHVAIQKRSPKITELLLNHGADITIPDENGQTPLFLAADDYFNLNFAQEMGQEINDDELNNLKEIVKLLSAKSPEYKNKNVDEIAKEIVREKTAQIEYELSDDESEEETTQN